MKNLTDDTVYYRRQNCKDGVTQVKYWVRKASVYWSDMMEHFTECVHVNSWRETIDVQGMKEIKLPKMRWSLDGLVSFFNGLSTFIGYLMPKPFS